LDTKYIVFFRLDIKIQDKQFKASVTNCNGKKVISVSSEDDVIQWHLSK